MAPRVLAHARVHTRVRAHANAHTGTCVRAHAHARTYAREAQARRAGPGGRAERGAARRDCAGGRGLRRTPGGRCGAVPGGDVLPGGGIDAPAVPCQHPEPSRLHQHQRLQGERRESVKWGAEYVGTTSSCIVCGYDRAQLGRGRARVRLRIGALKPLAER
jgi:hypothetical protein